MLSSEKSKIIVLHLTKYGDSGSIVHCIDSESGRSGILLRGLGKNRISIAQFHPLSILNVVTGSSPKSRLKYMKEFERTCRLDAITGDLYKRTIAMFISEVLYRSIRDNDSESNLFEWLSTSIQLLNETDGPVANFHIWWLTGFCNILGFKPLIFEKNNSADNDATGMFIFSQDEQKILRTIIERPFDEVMAIPLTGNIRNEFAQSLLKYLSFHLSTDISSKSLAVLHDVMR